MAKPTKVALIYFDLPGRAEVTRILLNYAGIPFEDRHVTRDQWPELKPTTPFGQLPVLEVGALSLDMHDTPPTMAALWEYSTHPFTCTSAFASCNSTTIGQPIPATFAIAG